MFEVFTPLTTPHPPSSFPPSHTPLFISLRACVCVSGCLCVRTGLPATSESSLGGVFNNLSIPAHTRGCTHSFHRYQAYGSVMRLLACKIVMPAPSGTAETKSQPPLASLLAAPASRGCQRWPMHYTRLVLGVAASLSCSLSLSACCGWPILMKGGVEKRSSEKEVMAAAEDVKCVSLHPKQTRYLEGREGGFKHSSDVTPSCAAL